MNCQTCGYRLWALPPGNCPECGRPFKPSQFEFSHCAVQYTCPHCPQVYYGTDERGHLVPSHFNCVACGNEIDMDQMSVQPAGGIDENRTARARNPWLDRRRIGWFKAWFSTIGQGLIRPDRLIRATPPNEGTLEAAAYYVVTTCVYYLIALVPFFAMMIAMQRMISGAGGGPSSFILSGMGMVMFMPLLVMLLFVPLWALVTHGILRLTGTTEHGLGRTWQAVCYGSGGNCFMAVPCLGMHLAWIGWIWWAVTSAVMLVKGQAVTGLRAAVAVFVLPLLLIGGFFGWVGYNIYTVSSHTTVMPFNGRLETESLAQALTQYQHQNAHPPTHAIELLDHQRITADSYLVPGTSTFPDDVPMGTRGNTLNDAWHTSTSQWAAIVQDAVAALPPNVVAHRVGDFVFTCHGIDLASPPDPNLWVVVLSPDPDANAGTPWTGDHWVGTASGQVILVPSGTLAGNLQAENQLRATHGLPPIPDPDTITHASPATAP